MESVLVAVARRPFDPAMLLARWCHGHPILFDTIVDLAELLRAKGRAKGLDRVVIVDHGDRAGQKLGGSLYLGQGTFSFFAGFLREIVRCIKPGGVLEFHGCEAARASALWQQVAEQLGVIIRVGEELQRAWTAGLDGPTVEYFPSGLICRTVVRGGR